MKVQITIVHATRLQGGQCLAQAGTRQTERLKQQSLGQRQALAGASCAWQNQIGTGARRKRRSGHRTGSRKRQRSIHAGIVEVAAQPCQHPCGQAPCVNPSKVTDKKLLPRGALHGFAAADCWMHHKDFFGSSSDSGELFSLRTPPGLSHCALMALVLCLTSSAENAPRTSRNKGPARLVLFANLAFRAFLQRFFLLLVLIFATLQRIVIAWIFLILL
ncbi:MAG: hypothetical protein Q4A28_07835 [Brachymonas sp.]|nr:hypothetical protein [Brachymonas sp.]